MKAIIYTSNTGSTARYAKLLALSGIPFGTVRIFNFGDGAVYSLPSMAC